MGREVVDALDGACERASREQQAAFPSAADDAAQEWRTACYAVIDAHGEELEQASGHCEAYRQHANRAELHAAWDIYYNVFRRISKQIAKLTVLELQHVSPKLLEARDLELAVPGTYQADQPVASIRSFAPSMTVIASKQRPRKLLIHGRRPAGEMRAPRMRAVPPSPEMRAASARGACRLLRRGV